MGVFHLRVFFAIRDKKWSEKIFVKKIVKYTLQSYAWSGIIRKIMIGRSMPKRRCPWLQIISEYCLCELLGKTMQQNKLLVEKPPTEQAVAR